MLAYKTYIGSRMDMQHYKNAVMNATIEILDELFSVGDNVTFEFFAKPHGKSLEQFDLQIGSGNTIGFDENVLNYRPGLYYHECYQMTPDSPSEKVLLFYGVSEVI